MATPQRSKAPAKTRAPESTKATPATPAPRAPSSDAIAARAYELWRESGCAHGNDKAHWFQAERELGARTTLH